MSRTYLAHHELESDVIIIIVIIIISIIISIIIIIITITSIEQNTHHKKLKPYIISDTPS